MIGGDSCDAETELDLSRYPLLKTLLVDEFSYKNVNVTKLIGMSELEIVVIGGYSFSGTIGSLYVKNCPKLKYLVIDYGSFTNYRVIEIENVDALEVIGIGDPDKPYSTFHYAQSLELKSFSHSHQVMTRHAFSKITRLWLGGIPVLFSCCV